MCLKKADFYHWGVCTSVRRRDVWAGESVWDAVLSVIHVDRDLRNVQEGIPV